MLSVPRNQIRELPVCLADMGSLQVLKFEGNPISFPPRDALTLPSSSPSNEGLTRDTEVTEVATTSQIKKYLRQHTMNGRLDADTTGDDSSEAGETPRFPLKRVTSGRFPIKVNGADPPDARSPNLSRPPPIPSRSHYRGLSQQNTAIRRPGVMPLTIGNVNERLRSNSETQMRTGDLRERSDSRNRRMGIVSKKTSDLGTLDEIEANNRFSHYRGLSHGSAMQGAPIGTKSPHTPSEPYLQRPIYFRRLSILPERKRESKVFDPVVEAAKGILYSVFQIHPTIQMLMSLTSDGSVKRSSLEIVFYNTNSHVEELEQEIQRYDVSIAEGDDYSPRDNENVHRACQTLVSAYGHVCTLLADNIDTFVDNGDPRYIRTLLMLIYNSVMELRVTLSSVSAETQNHKNVDRNQIQEGDTIRPHTRQPSSVVSNGDRSIVTRGRTGTVMNNPNLRVAVNVPVPPSLNSGIPTAMMGSATPRSGESFSSATSRTGGVDFSEEDAQFERVFLSLQKSVEVALRTLPNFNLQLSGGLRHAAQKTVSSALIQDWKALIAMCSTTIQQTEILKNRLSMIKLKEPGVRSQPNFWNLCNNFISSWYDMMRQIKYANNKMALPPDTRIRLRPIQQSMKETGNVIAQSPWHRMLGSAGSNGLGSFEGQTLSPGAPITPQSAALGPAMQATVPITPQSASFAAAFHGNVFDRADALIANPGISMSRGGTLTRGHSGFNSLSSISSMSSDGGSGSASITSPNGPFGPMPLRLNGSKVAF